MTTRSIILAYVLGWAATLVLIGCRSQPAVNKPAAKAPTMNKARPAELVCLPPRRLDFCQAHGDCDHGQFCRDRGDRVKLCMGSGKRGEYCTDTIDCASGLFCKTYSASLRVCR